MLPFTKPLRVREKTDEVVFRDKWEIIKYNKIFFLNKIFFECTRDVAPQVFG